MDRYQKVVKPKPDQPINDNVMRITSQGLVRNYLTYATTLLQERHGKEIVLQAMGQAISKTVTIAEIIKRRIPTLHQETAISSVSITDVWEPIEEGLLPVEQTRNVSMISITLSPKELNQKSPGYQAPSRDQKTKPQYNYQPQYNYMPQQQQPRPRQARGMYNADSYGRESGRGRGRGWGWSGGGYVNYQENGGYSNTGRGGGRAGGWGYYGGGGYTRGRGGGGRGYGRGRGQMGTRSRGVGNQA